MPSFSHGTIFPAVEFRDDLTCRNCLPLLGTPPKCDDCDAKFSTHNCLGYKVRSLVKNHHGKSIDSLTHLPSVAFQSSNDRDEPLINTCSSPEEISKHVDLSTRITAEINAKRGDILKKRLLGENDGLHHGCKNL